LIGRDKDNNIKVLLRSISEELMHFGRSEALNSLPASVKLEGNIVSFHQHVKTYVFKSAYPP